MAKDYGKLQTFVEAAIDNPKHPVFALGYRHHPALQYYDLNVRTLRAITPAQFFEEQEGGPFRWTPKLEAVMALCETPDQPETPATTPAPDGEVAALRKQVEALTAKVEALSAAPAPAPDPAPEA